VDWEQMRQQALASGRQNVPKAPIVPPPFNIKLKRFLIRSLGSAIRETREFTNGALRQSSHNLGRLLQKITFRLHQLWIVWFICFPICWWNKLRGMRIGKGTHCSGFQVTWPHQVQIGVNCRFEPDIYFKFDGIWSPGPSIIIGDDVFLGRGCEFNIRKKIVIGRGCAIASDCKFIDHDHGITGKKLDETSGPEAIIELGEHVWLGCNVVILKGVNIGSGAVIGAGAVVTKNVPAGEIWGGVPARKISSRAEHSQTNNILPG
jgi:acetyltransferase-like isoleucine patch superfamily enzyme